VAEPTEGSLQDFALLFVVVDQKDSFGHSCSPSMRALTEPPHVECQVPGATHQYGDEPPKCEAFWRRTSDPRARFCQEGRHRAPGTGKPAIIAVDLGRDPGHEAQQSQAVR
jgi:hypothetical protein